MMWKLVFNRSKRDQEVKIGVIYGMFIIIIFNIMYVMYFHYQSIYFIEMVCYSMAQ